MTLHIKLESPARQEWVVTNAISVEWTKREVRWTRGDGDQVLVEKAAGVWVDHHGVEWDKIIVVDEYAMTAMGLTVTDDGEVLALCRHNAGQKAEAAKRRAADTDDRSERSRHQFQATCLHEIEKQMRELAGDLDDVISYQHGQHWRATGARLLRGGVR
jgi:hypothetical protein